VFCHPSTEPNVQFPINLNLEGRRCLIVGGGRIATRKAAGLAACGAVITAVAPEITDELAALAADVRRRPYAHGDLDGHWLVITATGDRAVDQAVYDDAEASGIWANSADDPERCSFTLAAVVRRGPVMVTASTGGVSPALSTWLRVRLTEAIGPEFADIAAELAERRAEVHARGESTEDLDWTPIIDEIVAAHRSTDTIALATSVVS
jgi:siroheme synthase-like protein